MTTLTIRRLDDAVKQRLRLRAARDGISMEEAARRILTREFGATGSVHDLPLAPSGTRMPGNIADRIAAIVAPFGGVEFPATEYDESKPFEFDAPHDAPHEEEDR